MSSLSENPLDKPVHTTRNFLELKLSCIHVHLLVYRQIQQLNHAFSYETLEHKFRRSFARRIYIFMTRYKFIDYNK